MLKRFSIAFLLLFPLALSAYVSPGRPTGFVNDFAGMLRSETVLSLNQALTNFAAETGNEISVVTIPTHGSDETIETYAVKLFEEWGIGKEEEDNGLLLLIARDDREVRIEVGYGLEPVITDIESGAIIREVLTPAFQAGQYDEGIQVAIQRIIGDIGRGEPEATKAPLPFNIGDLIYPAIFLLIFLSSILARSKSWWAGGVIGALIGWIFFSGLVLIAVLAGVGLLFDYIVSRTYQSSKARGIHPPWWIGGPRGPGGGGGFGGFGGGMSGGGGASGRW